MQHFRVDDTTLLSGTIQVEASNERLARDEAERLAEWIDLSGLGEFHRAEHRTAGCA